MAWFLLFDSFFPAHPIVRYNTLRLCQRTLLTSEVSLIAKASSLAPSAVQTCGLLLSVVAVALFRCVVRA
jgi:hypothetical protein